MSIITISRGTFGGGKAVAEALADHLGYSCISREVIAEDASREFGISEQDLHDAILEKPGFFNQQTTIRFSNLKYLRAALLERCKGFRTVYHGWGGHLLLQDVPKLLRVRITAGMEYRIKSAMDHEQLTREKAIELISNMDKNRSQWFRSIWGVKWSDPSLYDMVLNLDIFSIDSAVKTIDAVRNLPEFKVDDQTARAFEDQHLISRIWVALLKNKPTRGARIQMEADRGHVTITGDVGSMKIVNAIVTIAENVNGVKSVTNNIGTGAGWMW